MKYSLAGLHDEKGRLVPGHPGGPGQRYSKAAMEKKLALQESTTPEQVQDVMQSIYTLAMDTEEDKWVRVACMTLFLSYTVGKPAATVHVEKNETVTTVDMKAFSDETLRAIDALAKHPELAQKILQQETLVIDAK